MAHRWTIKEENKKREEIIELYVNQNKTIAEIGRILKISKKTVFKRMKRLNIPSTPERKLHYLNKKRGKLVLPDFSDKLAEFFGIMLEDGHINSGQIYISVNSITDKEYISYIKKLIKFLFKIEPGGYHRKNKNGYDLFVSSVDLINYLRKKGLSATNKVLMQVDIPSWIFTKDSYKISFLKGFFDTDGSIYKLRFGFQMAFCNRSNPLLASARKLLIDLGYHPSKISIYKFYLTRRPELERYVKEIGYGNPKHFKRAQEFGVV